MSSKLYILKLVEDQFDAVSLPVPQSRDPDNEVVRATRN